MILSKFSLALPTRGRCHEKTATTTPINTTRDAIKKSKKKQSGFYYFADGGVGGAHLLLIKGEGVDDVAAAFKRVVNGDAALARVAEAAVQVTLAVLAHDDAGRKRAVDKLVRLHRIIRVAATGADDALQLSLLRNRI
jgi:hypothetical protein